MKPRRRDLLKALAGLPVLGLMGYEVLRKVKYDKAHDISSKIINELGLADISSIVTEVQDASGGDLIRIGIVGYGSRGHQLARALGFMTPEEFKTGSDRMETQIRWGNLNVALIGICDVFDLHAERGLSSARHDIHTQGEFSAKHPVKRYRHYHEMLDDKTIDAVIISTPDHHHGQMTIDAIDAGKHVYCEKSPIRTEEEIPRVYEAVKNSALVFQLGHQTPQNAIYQQAREIIKRGIIGKISRAETGLNRNTPDGAWIRHLDANGKRKPGDEKSIDWKQWLGSRPQVPFSIERFYGWARFSDYDTGLFGQSLSHEFDAINQIVGIGIPHSAMASGGQYFYKEFGDIPDVLNCILEYPEKEMSLTFSVNLASSRTRPRAIYGEDAFLALGSEATLTPDRYSKRYRNLLDSGWVDPDLPMLSIKNGKITSVDAFSSATSQYYASIGLTGTVVQGKAWDTTHLHLRDWIHCIRNGGEPSCGIERAHEESVAIAMSDISYRENCRTVWDPVNKKITRV